MAQATVYSIYIETEARNLLRQRDQWAWARNKETGVAYVAVPSGAKVYHVRPDGRGCDCEATQHWNVKMCKHRRAVQLANHEDALAANTIGVLAYVAAASAGGDHETALATGQRARVRYEDLFGTED